MTKRSLITLLAAWSLLAAGAPAASAAPDMPRSVYGLTDCRVHPNHTGARMLIYVVKGPVTCEEAIATVRAGLDVPGWTYYDWTKSDDGTSWTDVWERQSDGAVIGAVLQAIQEQPPPPVKGRRCGSMRISALDLRITVRGISCRRGRAVIRASQGNPGRFRGFRCRSSRGALFVQTKCTQGRRVVVARFVQGQ